MRKRLLVSVVFGMAGLAAGLPIGDRLGLSAAQALIACTAAGMFIGYLLSIFLDIFMSSSTASSDSASPEN